MEVRIAVISASAQCYYQCICPVLLSVHLLSAVISAFPQCCYQCVSIGRRLIRSCHKPLETEGGVHPMHQIPSNGKVCVGKSHHTILNRNWWRCRHHCWPTPTSRSIATWQDRERLRGREREDHPSLVVTEIIRNRCLTVSRLANHLCSSKMK